MAPETNQPETTILTTQEKHELLQTKITAIGEELNVKITAQLSTSEQGILPVLAFIDLDAIKAAEAEAMDAPEAVEATPETE